jgi:hypothetical protein
MAKAKDSIALLPREFCFTNAKHSKKNLSFGYEKLVDSTFEKTEANTAFNIIFLNSDFNKVTFHDSNEPNRIMLCQSNIAPKMTKQEKTDSNETP